MLERAEGKARRVRKWRRDNTAPEQLDQTGRADEQSGRRGQLKNAMMAEDLTRPADLE